MEKTLEDIKRVSGDIEYLKGEYQEVKRFDVDFIDMIEWLTKNKHLVEHIISIGETVDKINKE